MLSEPFEVTLRVIDQLERLGVAYIIGGSLASSMHGIARTTMDADLLADLAFQHIDPLQMALEKEFYMSLSAIQEAVTCRRSFNMIHLETMFKVDVFIPKPRSFDRHQLERRVRLVIDTNPERTAFFSSAEDAILAKLDWYQQGHQISDRQWQDVLGMLRVQAGGLDLEYMRNQAVGLKIADLLEGALSQTSAYFEQ